MTSRYSKRLQRLLGSLTVDQRRRYELAARDSAKMAGERTLPEIVLVRLAERIKYGDALPWTGFPRE